MRERKGVSSTYLPHRADMKRSHVQYEAPIDWSAPTYVSILPSTHSKQGRPQLWHSQEKRKGKIHKNTSYKTKPSSSGTHPLMKVHCTSAQTHLASPSRKNKDGSYRNKQRDDPLRSRSCACTSRAGSLEFARKTTAQNLPSLTKSDRVIRPEYLPYRHHGNQQQRLNRFKTPQGDP